MQKTAEQIIVDIIAQSMELDAANAVWVRNQNRKIPADDQLYIIVGMTDSTPISASMFVRDELVPPDSTQQVEVTQYQAAENIQIDVVSRSNDALLRRWEVVAALRSIYAQQQMEKYGFKIARLPNSFVNSSAAEGGSQLNRFSLSFKCLVWQQKEKVLTPEGSEYYDDFSTRVDDAATISEETGIFEFEITAED